MSKKTKRERIQSAIRRRNLIIFVIFLMVVAGAATAGVLYYFNNRTVPESQPTDADKKQESSDIAAGKKKVELQDQASSYIASGNTSAANQLYETAARDAQTVNQKVALYIDLANVYYDSGQPDQAIQTALQAANLSNDQFLAADWLGRAYEDRKEYANAIKYYEIAKTSVASPQNEYNFDAAYYDRQISRVKNVSQGTS